MNCLSCKAESDLQVAQETDVGSTTTVGGVVEKRWKEKKGIFRSQLRTVAFCDFFALESACLLRVATLPRIVCELLLEAVLV